MSGSGSRSSSTDIMDARSGENFNEIIKQLRLQEKQTTLNDNGTEEWRAEAERKNGRKNVERYALNKWFYIWIRKKIPFFYSHCSVAAAVVVVVVIVLFCLNFQLIFSLTKYTTDNDY